MKRSKFSLSYTHLLACDMGELIPIGLTEVLPGDTVQHNTALLLRCSPLLAPVMHPVTVRIHHWFVPHRLVWDEWEEFITGGPDGMNASVFPTITKEWAVGELGDYMGLPIDIPGLGASALPFRGYNLIWNEHYRDQDLQQELAISTDSGPDTITDISVQNCAWEKDYFTSARPWEQKGPAITIPIGGFAPVHGIGVNNSTLSGATTPINPPPPIGSTSWAVGAVATAGDPGSPTGVYADLQGVSTVTINILREAFALQRFEEARARYGSRYTEYLRYLGVRSSDARLQRPEYLGGGKQVIQFSEVLQTAPGDTGDPVGDMHGHGLAAMRSNRYRRFIEEHGYVFSLMSVRPKTMYSQGIARHWNRRFKEDFWQKELQHIGQQEVKKMELYAGSADPFGVFGYQDRYDEYRRNESRVSGEFRTLLNYWHMSREFASEPALNAAFIKCTPTERIFADNQEKTLYVMAAHSMQARRLVAKTGSSFIF